jgi:hypothetical protein
LYDDDVLVAGGLLEVLLEDDLLSLQQHAEMISMKNNMAKIVPIICKPHLSFLLTRRILPSFLSQYVFSSNPQLMHLVASSLFG